MKRLIWTVLFLFGMSGIVLPTVYFIAVSRLPSLESEFDLERELRLQLEGEMIAFKAGRLDGHKIDATFRRPDFTALPKDLVALYLLDLGCPRYFQRPREEGLPWLKRVIYSTLLGKGLPGDGRCELNLAARLASRMGIEGRLEQGVAAHKLHGFLQKDQLIAYNLAITTYAPGVIGIHSAARQLFASDVDALSLGMLTELTLAHPKTGLYRDMQRCQNPTRMREQRNAYITELGRLGLISPEQAVAGREEKISCVK